MYQKPEIFFIAVAFLLIFQGSHAQENHAGNSRFFNEVLTIANEKYGIHQQLANGVYFEDTYRGANGHPYLLADQFTEGSVTFYGKEYNNVPLKYNLYGQQLLISHQERDMVFTSVLTEEFTTAFSLHGLNFRKMILLDNDPAFFQVVAEEGGLQCYYSWYRTRHESIGETNNKLYSFTGDQQRRYLVVDQVIHRYYNNWTFISVFDRPLRGAIRSFLRQHDLKIHKATDEQVTEVIRFIALRIHPSDL